ncbi:hypothetical protein [Nonomuraea cypriaca]|uniref:hypothetical protein n=1 Tax=Nonomuraea cypriaca TaxID=1187855 RepID=UPI001A9CB48E|nr:hypothetical protein [Nonomuraea cypriaca]
MQGAARVHVHAAIEEPAQPGRVLEVQLAHHHAVEPRLVEQVEERGAGPLAGVVEGVLVRGRAALDQ